MLEPEEYLKKARESQRIADHQAYVTYRFVKDPKFLAAIVEHIDQGFDYGMNAILSYEAGYKRIHFPLDRKQREELFKGYTAKKEVSLKKYLPVIREVHACFLKCKESPVTFQRKEKLVLCDEKYSMDLLSIESIKNQIRLMNDFIRNVETILVRNERLNKRSQKEE